MMLPMTNSFRQGLYNKLYDKRDTLNYKLTTTNVKESWHAIQHRIERLNQIEQTLNDTPDLSQGEYERFEARIEEV